MKNRSFVSSHSTKSTNVSIRSALLLILAVSFQCIQHAHGQYHLTCPVSDETVYLKYDPDTNKFKPVTNDDTDKDSKPTTRRTESMPWEEGENNHHHHPTTTTYTNMNIHASNNLDQVTSPNTKFNLRKRQSQQQQIDNIYPAKRCSCENQAHNHYYCILKNNENFCAFQTQDSQPLCFHSSTYFVFLSNMWPVALLWYSAILLFVISTDSGRNIARYFISKCCKNSPLSNRAYIHGILRAETEMRERDLQGLFGNGGGISSRARVEDSGSVTYILKTKEFRKQQQQKQQDDDSQENDHKVLTVPNTPESDASLQSQSAFHYNLSHHDDESYILQNDHDHVNVSQETDISNDTSFAITLPDESTTASPSISNSNNNQDKNDTPPISLDLSNSFHIDDDDDEQLQQEKENDYLDDDEVICTICIMPIEDGERIGALSCNHCFHVCCLKEWIKRKNVCPLCQQPDIAQEKTSDTTTQMEEGDEEVNAPPPAELSNTRITTRRLVIHPSSRIYVERRSMMSGIQRLREAQRDSLRSQLFHVNGDMSHTSNSSTRQILVGDAAAGTSSSSSNRPLAVTRITVRRSGGSSNNRGSRSRRTRTYQLQSP